jgi:transposase
MFIRRTRTRAKISGDAYCTYRLVETVRVGKAVRQRTLLNLGAQLELPHSQWPALAARIEELLHGQASLLAPEADVEELAQRFAAQLIARRAAAETRDHERPEPPEERFVEVDLNTLEMVRPRSVGVEQVALEAMRKLGFEEKQIELGFNRPQAAAAVGAVIGRMAAPGSELSTYDWLQHRTALGELLGYNYEAMDLQQLYRCGDRLLEHREALETHLFGAARQFFSLGETVTLYDLTNTYFEGAAEGIDKARHGRSKEKRSDCPLVTLGLVLDGSGFPRRSRLFAGNAGEAATLEQMLEKLDAAPGATVVMDAGIATEANLAWLKERGYNYIVVSRKRLRQFDPALATTVQTAGQETIQIQRVRNEVSGELLLYCYSPARAEKDKAIDARQAARFEEEIGKLANGLARPRTTRNPGKLQRRIGRIQQRYARAVQHYHVEVKLDETGKTATAIVWSKAEKPGTALTDPGVYGLRTTLTALTDAELWKTYSMLTNLEAVFRSLKTDLGLGPVFHRTERRVDAHLFISLLAYIFVHALRTQLKAAGINDSWEKLRAILSGQVRVTATAQRKDGRAVHVRKATRPEPALQRIYSALKLSANPGGVQRTLA